MTLKELEIGQSAIISSVGGKGTLRQNFLDMGLIKGAEVTLVRYAPMGDPMEIKVHGYDLTLRLEDAKNIEIDEKTVSDVKRHKEMVRTEKPHEDDHPGLGEGGRYHVKADENPLDPEEKLSFALVGNQNSGKTTLFNQLTGANQKGGKEGNIRGYKNSIVYDLPGIYSLSVNTPEEIESRDFILKEKPKCIINIVDATNIERNLYLTIQLMELDIPMVLALNMMDELEGNGGAILVNEMESRLGIPVVPISAAKNEGIDELIDHATHVAKYQERPGRTDFCDKEINGGTIHRAIHAIMHLIEDHAEMKGVAAKFAAEKIAEGDMLMADKLKLDQNEREMIEHISLEMEEERGLDRASAIADMRYEFIQALAVDTVIKPSVSKETLRTQKLDRILTGKWTAIPSFIVIMALIFWLTFDVIGKFLQDQIAFGVAKLTDLIRMGLENASVQEWLQSLILQGAIRGISVIISFLPIIVILFLFLSILKDTGYMARIAFVMDKTLRKIGLSGRSIVPMLIGFGCSVPAIMSTRTLPSERDRKMTIMMTPFMSCTAKIPIYSLFIAAFFPNHGGLVMISVYLLGIIVGILCAMLYKKTIFNGPSVPFVMELPNYRLPNMKNVGHLLWDKTKDFVEHAFTVVLLASIAVWLLRSFDFSFTYLTDASDSILAKVSGLIAPIFKPLGLNDWRVVSALVSGFVAKESVVATLGVLYGGNEVIASSFSIPSAVSLLAFCVLYTQCVASIAAIKRELGNKWAIGIVIWQCVVAWVIAFAVHTVAMLII